MTRPSSRILVTLSLILFPLLLFSPQMIGVSSFGQTLSTTTLSAYRRVALDILLSGRLPLWNPYAAGGAPLLGDGRVALLYPLSWLSFVFTDATRAGTLFALMNFVVAAAGSVLFARRLQMSALGVAVTTIGFTLSGSLVARVGEPTTMAAASLVPLMFWAVERVRDRASARHLIAFAMIAAAQVFAGDAIVVICTAVGVLIYTGMRSPHPRAIGNVALGLLLAVGLSAVQLFPWLAALCDTLTVSLDPDRHLSPPLPVGFIVMGLAVFAIYITWSGKRHLLMLMVGIIGAVALYCGFGVRSMSVVAFIVAVLAGIGAQRLSRFARYVPMIALGLVLIELTPVAFLMTRPEGPGTPRDVTGIAQFLKQQPAPFRVAVVDDPWLTAPLAMNGIATIRANDSLQPTRQAALLQSDDPASLMLPNTNQAGLFDARFAIVQKGMRPQASVGWPIAFEDERIAVLRNLNPSGHGYFPKQVVTALTEETMLGIMRSSVPANRIAVVDGLAEPFAQLVTIVGENDAKLIRRSPNEVNFVTPRVSYTPYDPPASVTFSNVASPNALSFETTTDRPRMLVLSEIDSPGWRLEQIETDGSIDPSLIYRTNYAFRGMLVGPGTSNFRMFYRPSAFYLGALVTAMCAIGCTATWLAPARPRLANRWHASAMWTSRVVSQSFDEMAGSNEWLATALIALAAIALGIAIQLRDGQYTVGAIALLACACGFAIAATRVPKIELLSSQRWRPDVVILTIAAALFFALLFGTLPIADRAFPICLGITALLAGTALAADPPLGRWTLPLILLAHLVTGAVAIHAVKFPPIDVYLFQHDAAEALLRGQNPYAVTNRNMYGDGTGLYAAEVQQGGRLLFGYPYMPLALYFTTAAQFFLGDYRYGQALAITLAGALIAYARPSRLSLLASILFLFAPRTFFIIMQGWTEPFQLLLLAFTVFCALRLPRIMPIALGLVLVSKQYMVVAVLVAPLLLRVRSSRAIWTMLWRAALTGAIVTLPLVVINFGAFWRSAVTLQFKQPFRLDALSFLVTMSGVKFDAAMRPSGVPIRGAVAFGVVALLLGTALAWWKARPSPRAFLLGVTLMLLLFFAFNKQAFANYYFFVVGAALMAVAVGPSNEMEPDAR